MKDQQEIEERMEQLCINNNNNDTLLFTDITV